MRFRLLVLLFLSLTANANPDDTEEASADFLDFLAEIEDSTGDGFEAWLEESEKSDKPEAPQNQTKTINTESN